MDTATSNNNMFEVAGRCVSGGTSHPPPGAAPGLDYI